jgi:hypothetical protein
MPPRNQDTTVAHAEDDIFDVVRKAVRQIGKEAASWPKTITPKQAQAQPGCLTAPTPSRLQVAQSCNDSPLPFP